MRILLTALVAAAALAVTPLAAHAENWPDGRLDAIASTIAGHPVQVWCEDDDVEWDDAFVDSGLRGETVYGFTSLSDPTIYLAPRFCETLHVALDAGPEQAGLFWLAGATLVLTHESVHQRGIADEAQTECTAYGMVGDVAARFFGLSQTKTVVTLAPVTKTKTVRVGKKTVSVRYTTYVRRSTQVANPDWAGFLDDARMWHESTPPEYRQGC